MKCQLIGSLVLTGLVFALPSAAQQTQPPQPPQGQNKAPAKDAENKAAEKATPKTAGDFFKDAKVGDWVQHRSSTPQAASGAPQGPGGGPPVVLLKQTVVAKTPDEITLRY